jgi:excisionase family DNA binding protein
VILDTDNIDLEKIPALIANLLARLMAAPKQAAKTAQDDGGLWSAERLAKYLDVPTSWAYEQARLGKLPSVQLGRYIRFRLTEVEAALKRTRGEAD